MMSDSDVKLQFEELVAKIKQSSLPEPASSLIDILLSLFNVNFNQMNDMRRSIENQTLTIQNLIQKLEKAEQEKSEYKELVKTFKTMLRSKDLDLEELKRFVFQRGREQKKSRRQKKSGKAEAADKAPKDERKQDGEKKKRNRLSNKEKMQNCDVESDVFFALDGSVLSSSTKDEATKEIDEFIEPDGEKYRFAKWLKSSEKILVLKTVVKVKNHVPKYVPADESSQAPAITGTDPEKDFLPKTPVGCGLMAQFCDERFQKRIPMNRIARAASIEAFPISRQQMAGYFIKASDWIRPAYEHLKSAVLSAGVIHLDETFVHCQEEEKNRQYMFVFASENGCFYHYSDERSQKVPYEILQNHFGGDKWTGEGGAETVISTDGWYPPEWLKDENGGHKAKLVGCMVHLRRYFWNVCSASEKCMPRTTSDYFVSSNIVDLMREFFRADKECKTPEERTQSRKSGKVRELFDKINEEINRAYRNIEIYPEPRKYYTAKYVKALTYARNQWIKFARIMEDGNIPLDNSAAERCIRDFAVLRHAVGCGSGSIEGAKSTAIHSSFHETCKKFGVRLSEYMEFLFRYIGRFKKKLDDKNISSEEKNSILEACMPWNFAKA